MSIPQMILRKAYKLYNYIRLLYSIFYPKGFILLFISPHTKNNVEMIVELLFFSKVIRK